MQTRQAAGKKKNRNRKEQKNRNREKDKRTNKYERAVLCLERSRHTPKLQPHNAGALEHIHKAHFHCKNLVRNQGTSDAFPLKDPRPILIHGP